ncbi:Crp/Fnr family transcriptional regulator [Sandaracinobacteroides saxicola]|uniref:Crp/Fnr family transcriptional regulator n=1 Tax=Sandaracinobacteroides saxicola TaxID=2759707 RepID=A0A7G5IDR0_9SPHN|nr:Crp/Fnr family transcriptional regulator [Sandaracinobacteroides saxicola]QMW21502.1 Crp/Fnr family transcriptional regulator [Sandaracinobacteroides saxicola]
MSGEGSAAIEAAVDVVSRQGWLAACPAPFRLWMVERLEWRRYPAGSGITHAGDTEGALYCVGSGQMMFVSGISAADIGIGHFGLPGSWWGQAPVMNGKRMGSATAYGDSLFGALRRPALLARLAEHPAEWQCMMIGMTEIFTTTAGAHSDLLISSSVRRVAATILRLGGWRHRLFKVDPPASFLCTHEQLAGAAALSRNTVGKHIRAFEEAGLIDARYGSIAILDRRGLRAIVEREQG